MKRHIRTLSWCWASAAIATWLCCSAAHAENVALGKFATANSTYDPINHGPERAVDGDVSTQWAAAAHGSPANPLWLKVDLGQVYDLQRVALYGPDSGGIYWGFTVEYILYGSLDDTQWTELGRGTLIDSPVPDLRNDEIFLNAQDRSQRYLRFTGIGGTHWTHLYELEAYPVPEPSTWVLLGTGALGLLTWAWGRKRTA